MSGYRCHLPIYDTGLTFYTPKGAAARRGLDPLLTVLNRVIPSMLLVDVLRCIVSCGVHLRLTRYLSTRIYIQLYIYRDYQAMIRHRSLV